MSKKISTKKDHRDLGRAGAILAKAMFQPVFKMEENKHGDLVKVWLDGNQPTKADVAAALKGKRVVDEVELHEELGVEVTKSMIKGGLLKKVACGFAVTAATAEYYGLPKPRGGFLA